MDGIGARLQAARLGKVWTQADLAGAAGVPVVTISRIENGHHAGRPRQSTIRKLAGALGVDPAWLLFGDDAGGRAREGVTGER